MGHCTFVPAVKEYKNSADKKKDKKVPIFERLTEPREDPKPYKNPNCTFKPCLIRVRGKGRR